MVWFGDMSSVLILYICKWQSKTQSDWVKTVYHFTHHYHTSKAQFRKWRGCSKKSLHTVYKLLIDSPTRVCYEFTLCWREISWSFVLSNWSLIRKLLQLQNKGCRFNSKGTHLIKNTFNPLKATIWIKSLTNAYTCNLQR